MGSGSKSRVRVSKSFGVLDTKVTKIRVRLEFGYHFSGLDGYSNSSLVCKTLETKNTHTNMTKNICAGRHFFKNVPALQQSLNKEISNVSILFTINQICEEKKINEPKFLDGTKPYLTNISNIKHTKRCWEHRIFSAI